VADPARARRLSVRIREVVASTIELTVKDPRLGMVTITDAKLSPDLRDAKVFYTVLGDETARTASRAALESAKGVIRSAVGRATGLKFTPTLAFEQDVSPERVATMEHLLAQAQAADAAVAAVREGAEPAGEPDPYRHRDEAP
jgi:ribosome-binding factor A